jgi:hypothetical protein
MILLVGGEYLCAESGNATDSTLNWLAEQHTGILYNGNYGPYYVSYCV